MTAIDKQPAPDATQTVSALGLRWAALRGMLNSPLIMAEDQRPLREELMRELEILEQNFSVLQSRSALEVSAKIDIAKSALRDKLQNGHGWVVDLLDSIQIDLHLMPVKSASRPTPTVVRNNPTPPPKEENTTPLMSDGMTPLM